MTVAEGFSGPSREFELSINPVVGLRAFKVDYRGRLTGIHMTEEVYRPGVNVATCGYNKCQTENIEGCVCGYYAYFSDAANTNFLSKGRVGGIVRGYGRTVVGTNGFRATRSDLVALFPLNNGGSVKRPSRFRYLYPTYDQVLRMVGSSAAYGWTWTALVLLGIAAVTFTVVGSVLGWWPVVALAALAVPWGIGLGRRLYWAERLRRYYCRDDCEKKLTPLVRRSPSELARVSARRITDYRQADSVQLFERLKVLYPDVPVYKSRRAAVKAHRLSVGEDFITPIPGPDTDPEFWGPVTEVNDYIAQTAAEVRARARR